LKNRRAMHLKIEDIEAFVHNPLGAKDGPIIKGIKSMDSFTRYTVLLMCGSVQFLILFTMLWLVDVGTESPSMLIAVLVSCLQGILIGLAIAPRKNRYN
jgi:hypothetical protein